MRFSEYDGKTAFITGVSSGIGYAQALGFLKQGANVFGTDKNEAGLQELKRAYPETFAYRIADVSIKEDVIESVHQAICTFNRIQILVNTAGILDDYRTTLETSDDLWNQVMDTNVKGVFNVTNQILPHMLKWKNGVIVNTASIAGFVAGGGGAAYTASKHAVIGYTKQLSYDYSRKGIRVNAIAPGAIKTPMNAADFVGDGKMAAWVAEETPAGRWAQPEEVANATLFLASDAADYIHGTVLTIDGGWTMK